MLDAFEVAHTRLVEPRQAAAVGVALARKACTRQTRRRRGQWRTCTVSTARARSIDAPPGSPCQSGMAAATKATQRPPTLGLLCRTSARKRPAGRGDRETQTRDRTAQQYPRVQRADATRFDDQSTMTAPIARPAPMTKIGPRATAGTATAAAALQAMSATRADHDGLGASRAGRGRQDADNAARARARAASDSARGSSKGAHDIRTGAKTTIDEPTAPEVTVPKAPPAPEVACAQSDKLVSRGRDGQSGTRRQHRWSARSAKRRDDWREAGRSNTHDGAENACAVSA